MRPLVGVSQNKAPVLGSKGSVDSLEVERGHLWNVGQKSVCHELRALPRWSWCWSLLEHAVLIDRVRDSRKSVDQRLRREARA